MTVLQAIAAQTDLTPEQQAILRWLYEVYQAQNEGDRD